MIPYSDTIEDCARHLRRTLKALCSERTYYHARTIAIDPDEYTADAVVLLASIEAEITKVENALDGLAGVTT